MATKRGKAQAFVDLTGDDDDNEPVEEPKPKRRRAAGKLSKAAIEAPPAEHALTGSDVGGEAGPSSDGPTAPTRGGKRKTKAKADEAEKERRVDSLGRTATYRPKASQDVRARIQRAMPGSSHRMFLVDSRQLSSPGTLGGPAQEFHVLGATGNVYTVCISRSPSCSCPDFAKGNLCKHVLFVMLRVLRQSPDDPVIWQRGLLAQEVERVLGPLAAAGSSGTAAVDQSVLAAERVRERYAAITGSGGAAAAAASSPGDAGGAFGSGVQRAVEGECPICYEEMVPPGPGPGPGPRSGGGRGGAAVTFCMSCGNNMHKACFDVWANTKRSGGNTVTCVYCRAPWKSAAVEGGAGGNSSGGGGRSGGEYVNLSQYSDAHRNAPSLEELYGSNAYFIMANNGDINRREAVRMHAAARGWS